MYQNLFEGILVTEFTKFDNPEEFKIGAYLTKNASETSFTVFTNNVLDSSFDEKSFDKLHVNNVIHAEQPGSGKSTYMIDQINSNHSKRHLIIGPTHELLEELESKIDVPFKVICGFEHGCAKYGKNEYPEIEKMHKDRVPAYAICIRHSCVGRCRYREQFQHLKDKEYSIGIPINLLVIVDFNAFDRIYVEESTQKNGQYEDEMKKIEVYKEWKKVQRLFSKKTQEMFISFLKEMDPNILLSSDIDFAYKIRDYNEKVAQSSPDDVSFMKDVCKLNFDRIFLLLEFKKAIDEVNKDKTNLVNTAINNVKSSYLSSGSISKYSIILDWQIVLFYMQMQSGLKQLTYLWATFAMGAFKSEMQLFENWFPRYKTWNLCITSSKKNLSSYIYLYSKKGYFKGYFDKYNFDSIREKIKYQKKLGKKVSVLTFKDVIKRETFLGVDAFHFGASHGVNKYSNYDVLFVIGTYLPGLEFYRKEWVKYYPNEQFPDNINKDGKTDVEYSDDGEYKLPVNEKLRYIYEQNFMEEVYDSIHRVRPLNNSRTIFYYGKNMPYKLKDELYYVKTE